MARERRLLGTKKVLFVDGSDSEVKFFAVPNYDKHKLLRLYKSNKFRNGKFEGIVFEEDEYLLKVLKIGVGTSLSEDDLKDIESPSLKDLYDEFYPDELPEEKKDKSSDIPEQK